MGVFGVLFALGLGAIGLGLLGKIILTKEEESELNELASKSAKMAKEKAAKKIQQDQGLAGQCYRTLKRLLS